MKSAITGAGLAAGLLAVTAPVQAAEWWLQLGALQSSFDTTAQISSRSSGIEGTSLGLEDDLGVPERRSAAAMQFGVRFARRWHVDGEAFSLNRSGSSRPLDTEVTVDDTTYAVSAVIDTRFESRVLRLGLGYALVQADQGELGVSVGAHITRFHVRFVGTATAGGSSASALEDDSVTAPLPTIGLFGQWQPAPGWRLAGRVDVFKLRRGSDEGRLTSANATLVRELTPGYGLGLGWRFADYVVSTDSDARSARVEYRFSGPQLFFEARF